MEQIGYERIRVHPLSPQIGAEIRGLDLAKPLDLSTFEELHRAFLAHQVIFFRGQDITAEQHVAFARLFGELETHPFVAHKPGHPEVMVLRHGPDNRGRENTWHSDVTWRQAPSLGSVLRAVEVPEIGGDTLFANMQAAYLGLGDATQRLLSGLTAIHDFVGVFGRGLAAEALAEMRAKYPPAEHPVVRTHPETGRKGLYVNAAFTTGIKGMTPAESRSLLALLYRQAAIPEYQCRFRWENNAIAFWDNRACQHYAVSDYWPKVRHMERVTIAGDRPF
ncbi:MAG TPA: TauD/TfdA family dioxygenase [Myxococcota bacterium]|nr:TauD/TfdA family dioxygenase [Myxococcota bacterium]